MQPNPFTPPLAQVGDVRDDLAEARRPLSVWIFQVLAALLASFLALMAVDAAPRLLSGRSDLVVKVLAEVLASGALVATIVGSQRRHRLSRWGGLLFIALTFGFFAWAATVLIQATSHASRSVAGNASTDVLGLVFGLVTLVPTVFWFWAFGFSAKARAWFAFKVIDAQQPWGQP